MNAKLKSYLDDVQFYEDGVSTELIEQIHEQLDFILPQDYLNLMREFNGGEGPIGENSWLTLYRFEELVEVNKDYSLLMEQIPDYFLFGKDAADTGYAFHKQYHTYHGFGLMSSFETDPMDFCLDSLELFIEFLFHYE
jgi:hypothetical protein